jgi:hypothetical protein
MTKLFLLSLLFCLSLSGQPDLSMPADARVGRFQVIQVEISKPPSSTVQKLPVRIDTATGETWGLVPVEIGTNLVVRWLPIRE